MHRGTSVQRLRRQLNLGQKEFVMPLLPSWLLNVMPLLVTIMALKCYAIITILALKMLCRYYHHGP